MSRRRLSLEEYRSEWGVHVKVGDSIELKESSQGLRDGDYIRVRQIFQDPDSKFIILRGWRLKRVVALDGLIHRKMNELFIATEEVDRNQTDKSLDELACENFTLSDLLGDDFAMPVKRDLIITNQPFGLVNEGVPADGVTNVETRETFRNTSRLVCRWVFIVCTGSVPAGSEYKYWWPRNADLRRIRCEEADVGSDLDSGIHYRVADWKLIHDWTGRLPSNDSNDPLSFADFFAGCGGVTVGAVQAGLDLQFGVDYDKASCQTYEANNYPLTTISTSHINALNVPRRNQLLEMKHIWLDAIHDFIQFANQEWTSGKLRVDVIHMSPPCPYFSTMNIRAGLKPEGSIGAKRDDDNRAVLYSIPDILDITRPRVATLEEVDGIFKEQDYGDFRCLITFFTDRDFSVSWRRDIASDHGVPSLRKRLILRASCPGGALPRAPPPTYGPNSEALVPYRTINECINHLNPTIHTHHDPNWDDLNEVDPDSGDVVLRTIIMCTGTKCRHPGGRPFTIRELATLSTFPDDFAFPNGLDKKSMLRQIGNSVPPAVAKALMESVKATLEKENAQIRQQIARDSEGSTANRPIDLRDVQMNNGHVGTSADQPIVLSDESDSDSDDSEDSDTTMRGE
ncbi:MAG: hypothetical protein Q9159_002687 [Coniocarpon cinnabarinum]